MDLHIKDVLKQYVNKGSLKHGLYTQKINDYWHEQMSPSIVSRTKSIIFEKGVLTLIFDSSPLKNELFNNRDRIKELINTHLEEEVIHVVLIK